MNKKCMVPVLLLLFMITCSLQAQSDTVFNNTDLNNQKQGFWRKTYPNGKIMYKGYFKDNKPVGELRRYFESGALKAVLMYDDQGENANARLFYEDGTLAAEGKYFNSLKDSLWIYYSYYNRSVTSREIFTRGVRNGLMINYYSNGDVSEKIEWKNDKKWGIWEQYFQGNILKLKASYVDGRLEGPFIVYSANSKPYITGNYKNDQREGEWKLFNAEGNVQSVLNYQAGKTLETNKLNADQQEFFKLIDEGQGKYNEPDETDFVGPQAK